MRGGGSWILEGAVIFLITLLLRLLESVADLGFQAGGGEGKIIFLRKLESKKEREKSSFKFSLIDEKFTFKLTRAKREKFF